MRYLLWHVYLCILLVLTFCSTASAEVMYDGQSGRISKSIDAVDLLQIDGTTYRVIHNTKVGYMISPDSVTTVNRHDFPFDADTQVYFNAEPLVDGENYQNLEFIFRSVD